MLFSQIRQYVKGILANSFINKSTLDKLGEDNNGLTFNGNNIEPPQKLTAAQMAAIKAAFVIDAPRNGYPVLFDETGAEHFVGWYKYANGTKKPMYEKTLIYTGSVSDYSRVFQDELVNCDKVFKACDVLFLNTFAGYEGEYFVSNNDCLIAKFDKGNSNWALYVRVANRTITGFIAKIRYTLITDTPQ